MTENGRKAAVAREERAREARQKRNGSMYQTQTHVSRSDDHAISMLAARYSISRYAMIRVLIRDGLAQRSKDLSSGGNK